MATPCIYDCKVTSRFTVEPYDFKISLNNLNDYITCRFGNKLER